MADTKLSALTALATEPADTDELYINDGGTSKRITYGTLKTELLNRANHTGTDSTTLISALSEVTVASGDYIMILDVSTSPVSLKKILASDFATAAQANATHTGDATGATALTLQPEAISGKGTATASGSDYVLVLDTSDSPNTLKKALVSDLGSAFGVSDITGAGAITVAGTDLLVVVDTSASPQVLGQVTAQAVADLFDASGYLPLSGGTMTGSIAFSAASPEQTVDGRIISVDGAKLDTIETNADVTDTANVTAAGALMDSEVTNLAAVKAFDPTDYATAAQGATADSALQNVVEDTTPQLGGSLDVNGQKIVSTANGNIDIEPNGTGNVLLGNFTFDADQTVGAGQDNYVLTYDNGTGLISLEAAAGGGGDLWSDAVDSDIVPTGADSTYDLGTTTDRFAQTYTDTIWITDGDITASVADGASAVAFDFNNTATLSTSGANLARFSNNGTAKLNIGKDGQVSAPSGLDLVFRTGDNLGAKKFSFVDSTNNERFYIDSDGYWQSATIDAPNSSYAVASAPSITRVKIANDFIIFPVNITNAYIDAGSESTTDRAPNTLNIKGASAATTASTNIDGGAINISAGNGASGSAGDADGGDINLTPGTGYGTGDHGVVNMSRVARLTSGYTVATLPTASVGMIARVTDADTPAVGSTVTGGGAAAALVWYNGSNWTVMGV